MKILSTLILFFLTFNSFGQNAYTQNLYSFSVENDIQYGTALNYAGFDEDLYLDIYKPLNDNNCNRPCLVLIHGGAWAQGSKDATGIQTLAEKFVQKGWVVAAINYRLGTHGPDVYDENYPSCTIITDTVNSVKCWNTADSAEIFRANYRGQQDAKGAIRFVKGRHLLDSTDVANFYVLGESAGAFVALEATFMNDLSEKKSECGVISDAPTPDPFLADCLPTGYSLSRPDLGDIDGSIAVNNGYDASVQGVGSIFGGTFGTDLFNNTTDWPSIYLFHQEKDPIVSYEYAPILSRLDSCLVGVCPPFTAFPFAHGSNSINTFLTSLPTPPVIQFDSLQNSDGQGDCADLSGHDIDDENTRTQNIANLFAQRIFANGNTPSSACIIGLSENIENDPRIYPNPSNAEIHVELNPNFHTGLTICSADGKVVGSFEVKPIQNIQLETGIYFFNVTSVDGRKWSEKVVVL